MDDFASVIEESAAEQRTLAKRARRLGRTRSRGASWEDVMSRDAAPALPAESSHLIARLSGANTRLRHALASALRAEGMGIEQIARLFGVTHQRISRILGQRPE
jgi:predicted component of type VI protein secretion system